MSTMATLVDYVEAATTVYRKGEVIKTSSIGEVHVLSIDLFPALPQDVTTTVDCHFVTIGFTEALATLSHAEFYELVLSCAHGHYQNMEQVDWSNGPSYIAIGAWIGDQTLAFRFMACVQAHGLGEVITPKRLHITDEAMADQMAGLGYIMLSGLRAPEQAPVMEP
jgi:hypothetical protein